MKICLQKKANPSDWEIGRQFQKNVAAIQSENDFAAAMSNIKPTEITDSLYSDSGQELNGIATDEGVKVSTNGSQSVPASIKHEWLHMFEKLNPEAYREYKTNVLAAARETNSAAVDNRIKFLKDNYDYNQSVAEDEIVAELTGGFNTKAIQRMAEGNNGLATKLAAAMRTAKREIRQTFTNGKYTSPTDLQLTFNQLNSAEKQYIQGLEHARNAADSAVGTADSFIRYSANDTESMGIKEQIRKNADAINKLAVVKDFEYDLPSELSASEKRKRIIDAYSAQNTDDNGNAVITRPNFGDVSVGTKDIQKGFRYLNDDSEYVAVLAVPDIIKNGVEIHSNENHKNRNYSTVTFAAPVTINGVTGNMAVVVKNTDKNKYKMHRILTPDGNVFEIRDSKNSSYNVGTADNNISGSPTITTVSNNSIRENGENVKYSIKENQNEDVDINEIVNSDMTPDEKRTALEERVHFVPRGGKSTTQNIVEQAQQRSKEHFDKMHKVKESDYTEDDWASYGEDFGTENVSRELQRRLDAAEERDREAFDERYAKAFPEDTSRYSEEDWDNLTSPVPPGYDWTKDAKHWEKPTEKPKTQAELEAEADETVKTIMAEKGVDSPDKLAEKTVSREDTKKRNRQFYLSKEGIQTLGSRLYTDVVDDMHPFWNYNKSFEKMQTRTDENGKKIDVHTYSKQNPYKMAINAKDASSRSAYLVTDYLTDFDGNVLGKGLIDTLAEGGISKEDYGAFNEYLVANHALEWLDEKGGGKYKKVYEDDRLNNRHVVKRMVDAFEKNHPNFKQAAEKIYDWQRKLMKAWLVDTGVITQDQYNYLTETYPHYVPFYRETDVAAAGGNTGLANLGSVIKKAEGGNKRILSPIENIMYNAASYVNHASKHAVTKAAVDMYDILESDPENNVLRAYWEEVFPTNPNDFDPTTFVKKGQTEAETPDATQEKSAHFVPRGGKTTTQNIAEQAQHTPEQLKIMQEYENAVDEDLLNFVQRAKENPNDNKTVFLLENVSDRMAQDIKNLTDIDTSGYGNTLKNNSITHIENDHGKNGTTDRSMADDRDIARIQYVLDNYDGIELLKDVSHEYSDRNQNRAPLIKISKRIDGTYYVIEAVPDTKKHQIAVVSAYKTKAAQQKGTAQSHDPNVRNVSVDTAFNNTVSQDENGVKHYIKENEETLDATQEAPEMSSEAKKTLYINSVYVECYSDVI